MRWKSHVIPAVVTFLLSCSVYLTFFSSIPAAYDSEQRPDHSQIQKIQIDVLSIGSNSRPERLDAQQRTWAQPNKGTVRNFFKATEEDDWEEVCRNGCFTQEEAMQVKEFCRQRYSLSDSDKQDNNLSNWYMHMIASTMMMRKPADMTPGWVCAQKRFILALVKVLNTYKVSAYPDYLLLVDDDTWYDMDQLTSILSRKMSSSSPFVGAGCRIIYPNGRKVHTGGMGLVFSRGSLQRLLRPLHGIASQAHDDWEEHVQNKLQENLAFEQSLFNPGMSLTDIMDAYVKAEAYDNVKTWTRGYCFHSDNFIDYIIEHYLIHKTALMDSLNPLKEFEKGGTKHQGYCDFARNTCPEDASTCQFSDCPDRALVCHYQTANDMFQLTAKSKIMSQ